MSESTRMMLGLAIGIICHDYPGNENEDPYIYCSPSCSFDYRSHWRNAGS